MGHPMSYTVHFPCSFQSMSICRSRLLVIGEALSDGLFLCTGEGSGGDLQRPMGGLLHADVTDCRVQPQYGSLHRYHAGKGLRDSANAVTVGTSCLGSGVGHHNSAGPLRARVLLEMVTFVFCGFQKIQVFQYCKQGSGFPWLGSFCLLELSLLS